MISEDNIYFRRSEQKDYSSVNELLKQCFGDRERYGALENLEGRYLLAFDDDKLIAMTGIFLKSPTFDGSEIDWTCILPEYRKKGIITKMMTEIIKDVDNDIYCSCLRLHDNKDINLKYVMNTLGFECVKKGYRTYHMLHTDACNYCIYRLEKGCVCYEDLYVKRPHK